MPDYAFGRISPPVLPHNDPGVLHFSAARKITLRPAPIQVGWWKEELPRIMGGNDRFGTCGPVSYAQFLKLSSSYTQAEPVVLSDDEIAGVYKACNPGWNGGSQGDRGVIMSQLFNLMMRRGPRGIQLEQFFAINPNAFNNIRWSIRINGPAAFGVFLTDRDLQRTRSGDPWTDSGPGDPSMGHAITVYDYSGNTWEAESWGERQLMTTSWLEQRLEECYGFIHPYQFNPDGISFTGLDKQQMLTDAGLI